MLEDEIYRYRAGTDPETGKSLAMLGGKIPVELVYYTKQPDDWWGYGFCEELISMQLAANRQLTNVERSIKANRGITSFDSDAIDAKDVQSEEDAWVPFRSSSMGSSIKQPVFHIPPASVGPEVGGLLGLISEMSDEAAGYRSGIIFGQAEGRTESGPAVSTLNANAQSALVPVLSRIFKALGKTYPEVLNMLRNVWPPGKIVRTSGPNNVGKELAIQQDGIPWSSDVIIKPTPLLPNGTSTLANVLFQLKQMPGDDGTIGSAVGNKEFMESLQAMDLLPPKLSREDEPSARIQSRINRLINDGNQPGIPPADPTNPNERLALEDHTLAMQMIRKAILNDAWLIYSPEVQQALLQEFTFHKDLISEGFQHPNSFDDDIEQFDAVTLENYLAAAEQALDTTEGEFTDQGIPIGLTR